MNPIQTTPLEAGNRMQLPADWASALGLHGRVALERTNEGILVRPCPRATWEEILASKLVIGTATPDQDDDDVEVTICQLSVVSCQLLVVSCQLSVVSCSDSSRN